jgi:hypothetical protein
VPLDTRNFKGQSMTFIQSLKRQKKRWIWGGVILLIVIGSIAAWTWDQWSYMLVYNRPLRYDQPFHKAIAGADRIIVRRGGFNCCGPVDNNPILFEITDSAEVAEIASQLQFVSRTTNNSSRESCQCCGYPGMDWYKGDTRIALTSIQHGQAIRWRGFTTARWFGRRIGYGDGPLTPTSQQWLKGWLAAHGAPLQEIDNQ